VISDFHTILLLIFALSLLTYAFAILKVTTFTVIDYLNNRYYRGLTIGIDMPMVNPRVTKTITERSATIIPDWRTRVIQD